MKALLTKFTLIRVFCFFLGLLWIWILISPVQSHSVYHWEIVIGLPVVIIFLLVVEYFIKKSVVDKSHILHIEILILVSLLVLWKYLTS